MTIQTNARVAGATFLVYIGAGVAPMVGRPGALGNVLLSLVMYLSAFVLGATLYRITFDTDRDVAMVGMICRVAEGVVGAALMPVMLALRALRTAAAGTPDAAAAAALAPLLDRARVLNVNLGATFFAVGSLLFCWLLLRGRRIPAALAGLGVVASAVLVVGLPLQLAGILKGPLTIYMWLPMLAFEVPGGVWLLVKGVPDGRDPTARKLGV